MQGTAASDVIWEGRTLSLLPVYVQPEGEGAEGDRVGIPTTLSDLTTTRPNTQA